MAVFVLAWELGGGAGHCVNLQPLAQSLTARGHTVYAVMRNVRTAVEIFGDAPVVYLPAPTMRISAAAEILYPRTLPEILHNVGFGDFSQLQTLVDAWRQLFGYVRPDVVVCDHAPSALLASRLYGVRQAVIGTGFFSPPDVCPLPDLSGRGDLSPQSEQVERNILIRINRILESGGRPTMERLSQLYAEVDWNFLLTFSELDHYRDRANVRYWGMWSPDGGCSPEWPAGEGARLFAYLKGPMGQWKPEAALLPLYHARIPALIYAPAISEELVRQFEAPHLRFERRRVDMLKVAHECTAALLHGNNGTVTRLLLGGIPLILTPMYLEQVVFSRRVFELSAALVADFDRPDQIASQIMKVCGDDRYSIAAGAFANRYRSFDPKSSAAEIVGYLESI